MSSVEIGEQLLLTQEEREELRQHAIRKSLVRGEEVFHKGSPSTGVFWIDSGAAQVEITSPQAKDVIIRRLGPGELFGEVGPLGGFERTATVRTTQKSEVYYLDRRDFLDLLKRMPDLSQNLLLLLARRLRTTTGQLEDGLFLTMRGRLAKCILGIADEIGEPVASGTLIPDPMPQTLLARLVYANREDVNREMRSWERDGWITKDSNRLVIVDEAALQLIARAPTRESRNAR